MTSVLVSCAAWLVACCPIVLEPPSFWTAIANNSQVETSTRSYCVTRLIERHAHPGMSLTEFARLFDKAPWLNETVINWNKVPLCGYIPVDIAPNSTTLSFRAFPELLGVYFRVSGEIDGETCLQLLHGQESDSFTDAAILEFATVTGETISFHKAERSESDDSSPLVANPPPDNPPKVDPNSADSDTSVDRTIGKVKKLVGYLKGRVLGSLICKGMTPEQVWPILDGKFSMFFLSAGFCYETQTMILCYPNEGLTVRFILQEDGTGRLDNVGFWPLFEDTFAVFGGPVQPSQ